jgi:hypothetical protein
LPSESAQERVCKIYLHQENTFGLVVPHSAVNNG